MITFHSFISFAYLFVTGGSNARVVDINCGGILGLVERERKRDIASRILNEWNNIFIYIYFFF